MQNIKKYFEENGYIYGVSFKYAYQKWNYIIYRFESLDSALEWLHTEQNDLHKRELMTESEAKKYVYINRMYLMKYIMEDAILCTPTKN